MVRHACSAGLAILVALVVPVPASAQLIDAAPTLPVGGDARVLRQAAILSRAAPLAVAAASGELQLETPATRRPAGDMLSALQQKTRPGDTLRVVMNDGTERKGILAEVSVTSATLLVKGRREEVAEAATRRIVRENPDSLRNGARNGAIAGGVIIAAFLIPQAFHPEQSEVTVPRALIGAGFYVGTGAAIGVGIDALIKDHTVVYDRAAAPPPSITVAPLLAPHQAGGRVAIVW